MTDESSSGGDSSGGDPTGADSSGTDASGTDLHDAVEAFLDDTDTALEQYDKGYADADATLRVIQTHLKDLRDAAEE